MSEQAITQNAYAKHRGVTHRAVQKAIESGRLQKALVRQGAKTLVLPSVADQEWARNTDTSKPSNTVQPYTAQTAPAPAAAPAAAQEPSVPAGPSLAQSRAIREAYQARLAKLEYEERSGKLIGADEVRLAAFKAARDARNALLSIPDGIAAQLAATTSTFECHRIVLEEVKRVCGELAKASGIFGGSNE